MKLRRLCAMARGKDRMTWWHTAGLMSLIANCHRDPSKRSRPYSPKDFHPDFAGQLKLGTPVDSSTINMVIGAYVPAERAKATEARIQNDVELARKLADAQRLRLRVVA